MLFKEENHIIPVDFCAGPPQQNLKRTWNFKASKKLFKLMKVQVIRGKITIMIKDLKGKTPFN